MLEYFTTENDAGLMRLLVFSFCFSVLFLAERLIPWRKPLVDVSVRLRRHLSLGLLNIIFVRLVFPVVLVGTAIAVEKEGIGGLRTIEMPYWLYVVLSVICLDLVMYVQHRLMHKWPILWRFHLVHHTDRELDVTTGIRFHPIEMCLSLFFKMMGVAMVGPPVIAVIIFECLLSASTLFNHANIELPARLEAFLRLFIVTPNMHRIHHSELILEQQSNFGFFISLWDRIFESYKAEPTEGPQKIVIGVIPYYQSEFSTLLGMLITPFLQKPKKALKSERQILIKIERQLENIEMSDRNAAQRSELDKHSKTE